MNDLIEGCTLKGRILFDGVDLYAATVDPVEVRRRIGMVFQQPNPFPKSIYENIAFGARINGYTGNMDELVERSLRQAAVWDECKDKLKDSGYSLSGGQQQRIAIARAVIARPKILYADEPTGNLDIASGKEVLQLFKDLCHDEENPISILMVTHDPDLASNADRMLLLNDGKTEASDIRSAWGLDDEDGGDEE